jgi:hypothetical protein
VGEGTKVRASEGGYEPRASGASERKREREGKREQSSTGARASENAREGEVGEGRRMSLYSRRSRLEVDFASTSKASRDFEVATRDSTRLGLSRDQLRLGVGSESESRQH